MIKYSIIIPVYNVEKYLSDCVESVCKQEYQNYEIILVDDGSVDSSGDICDQIAKNNEKVIVIHKLNGGLSDARNTGIKAATGDYLLFCDSDDLWEDNKILRKATKCINMYNDPEVILFSGKKFFEHTGEVIMDRKLDVNRINIDTPPNVLRYLIDSGAYSMSACTKIIRRDFLLNNKLYFTKGLLGEDLDWFLGIMSSICNVKAIDSFNYCYRIRSGSITQTISTKYITDFLWILKKWIPELENRIMNKDSLLGVLAYTYMTNMMNLMKINKHERKQLLNEYLSYKWLLNYSKNKRIQIVRRVSKVIGIVPTAKLLDVYYNKILHH